LQQVGHWEQEAPHASCQEVGDMVRILLLILRILLLRRTYLDRIVTAAATAAAVATATATATATAAAAAATTTHRYIRTHITQREIERETHIHTSSCVYTYTCAHKHTEKTHPPTFTHMARTHTHTHGTHIHTHTWHAHQHSIRTAIPVHACRRGVHVISLGRRICWRQNKIDLKPSETNTDEDDATTLG
jgi:hypothetical protein